MEKKKTEEILAEIYRNAQLALQSISDILPAVNAYTSEVSAGMLAKLSAVPGVDVSMEKELVETLSSLVGRAFEVTKALKIADATAMARPKGKERAEAFCRDVIPVMKDLRTLVDSMEVLCSSERWPMPNYGDLMFRV